MDAFKVVQLVSALLHGSASVLRHGQEVNGSEDIDDSEFVKDLEEVQTANDPKSPASESPVKGLVLLASEPNNWALYYEPEKIQGWLTQPTPEFDFRIVRYPGNPMTYTGIVFHFYLPSRSLVSTKKEIEDYVLSHVGLLDFYKFNGTLAPIRVHFNAYRPGHVKGAVKEALQTLFTDFQALSEAGLQDFFENSDGDGWVPVGGAIKVSAARTSQVQESIRLVPWDQHRAYVSGVSAVSQDEKAFHSNEVVHFTHMLATSCLLRMRPAPSHFTHHGDVCPQEYLTLRCEILLSSLSRFVNTSQPSLVVQLLSFSPARCFDHVEKLIQHHLPHTSMSTNAIPHRPPHHRTSSSSLRAILNPPPLPPSATKWAFPRNWLPKLPPLFIPTWKSRDSSSLHELDTQPPPSPPRRTPKPLSKLSMPLPPSPRYILYTPPSSSRSPRLARLALRGARLVLNVPPTTSYVSPAELKQYFNERINKCTWLYDLGCDEEDMKVYKQIVFQKVEELYAEEEEDEMDDHGEWVMVKQFGVEEMLVEIGFTQEQGVFDGARF
ncbi:hypothetical protein M011DRAFT_456737 [Sporormia fimetaria CBS 119925]|uniref:Uncharacterized protein n=1 Tax=Sporormia fimetaria CBS 119925 TaxID=1340428 RepID=A0A6A6VLD3_9PLEO|nr:hypothetical protein M011DRAFT_456737 [Sporormia fimetaria CBS 119925]